MNNQNNFIEAGAFIVARKLFDSDVWKWKEEWRVFEFILGKALFSKVGYTIGSVNIPRGAYLHSYRKLIEDTEWYENGTVKRYTLPRIKRILDNLIEKQMLTKQDTDLGTLWYVTNYSRYQNLNNYAHQTPLQSNVTPETSILDNENCKIQDDVSLQRNGVTEHQRNNNNNDKKEELVVQKISETLNNNNIQFSEGRLKARIRKLLQDYDSDTFKESFLEAIESWKNKNLKGNFLKFWFFILAKDYSKIHSRKNKLIYE